MSRAAALVRAEWRSALSYRVGMGLSLAGLLVSVVPIYFVAGALQPTMAPVIAGQAESYFGFLVLGFVAMSLLLPAIDGIPRATSKAIRTGTLEALFATPASLASLMTGLAGYGFLWNLVRGVLFIGAAVILGATIVPAKIPLAGAILVLSVVAHVPFGLFATALLFAFRTTATVPRVMATASGLLGGVYYPTEVIPSWIESLSYALPLTYGLRSLRRVLLEGSGLGEVGGDLLILTIMTVALLALGWLALARGLRLARRNGNLAIY